MQSSVRCFLASSTQVKRGKIRPRVTSNESNELFTSGQSNVERYDNMNAPLLQMTSEVDLALILIAYSLLHIGGNCVMNITLSVAMLRVGIIKNYPYLTTLLSDHQ